MQITGIKVMGDSDKEYKIEVKDGQATCSCLAFVFHPETPCKHMRFALGVMFGEPVS